MSNQAQRLGLGAIGIVSVLVAWQAIGAADVFNGTWPTVTAVLSQIADPDRWSLYHRALSTTVREAALGFLIGATSAATLALVTSVWHWTRRGAARFAILIEAIPIIALGPLFITTLPREWTPIAIATFAVFFTMFVAVTTGLNAARTQHLDLLRVLGSGPFGLLWWVRLPFSIPGFLEGMKLAAPAAVLGAIVGEWFGTETGIGPLLITSMQNQRIPQLWAAGVVGAVPSVVTFGAFAVLQRAATRKYGD